MLKKIKYLFRDYFAFTRTETRGVFLLLVLIAVLLSAPFAYKNLWKKNYSPKANAKDQAMLDSLMAQLEESYQFVETKKVEKTTRASRVQLQPFDPNVANAETLKAVGFRPWIAERIIKYRTAGGKFVQKQDLLKVYGISEETYQKVYDYIELPETATEVNLHPEPGAAKTEVTETVVKEEIININEADTSQLKRLPGIGTVFANRIVKYRNMLGGFVDTVQFAEVYGLPPETIEQLQTQVVIRNTDVVQKINLNTANIKTLAAHPYISFKVAKAIVKHRENYGTYSKVEDVKEVYLVDEDLFAKIARYIVI